MLSWAELARMGLALLLVKAMDFQRFFIGQAPRFPEQKLMGNRQVDPEVQLGGAGPPLPVTKRSFAYDRTVLSTFMRRQASKKAHLCTFWGSAPPSAPHIYMAFGTFSQGVCAGICAAYI